jgi:hypothetical protein
MFFFGGRIMTNQNDTTTNANAENRKRAETRWRITAWSLAAFVLLLPLVAMQFSDQVNWSVWDFALAGTLLGGALLTFELVVRKTASRAYRAAAALALAGAFLLIWINGAVGIIGSEDEPANQLYALVLAVGIIGAVLARFQPQGMARAMFAAASAQVLVGLLALVAGWGTAGARWPLDIIGLTAFFAALFTAGGLLFQKAASQQLSVR